MEGKKIIADHISDKGVISNIYITVHATQWQNKPNNLNKKLAEDPNRHFSKNVQIANQVHKKMLNITNHQEKTNQNHSIF